MAKLSCSENFEEIAEMLLRVRMYGTFFLCDFKLKVAVDRYHTCLICATISLAIF